MIDSHCHLEMFKKDIPQVIKHAQNAGVNTIITISSDTESIDEAIKIAEQYPMVYATVGIHPHDAKDLNNEILKKIFELSRHPKVIAIGEIGLDYHYDHSPREIQREAFASQLSLARDVGLPVVIHSREAFEDTIKILKEQNINKGVMHCFSGNLNQAKRAMDMGFLISISGVVTFKNATKIKEVARFVPDDYLMIETDAPYLAPEPMRGKRNEPAFLIYTAKALAELRGVTVEDIDRITTVNVNKLFHIGDLPRCEIAYKIRDTLYLNVTNRCTNICKFCVRFHTDYVKGHNLRLEREPSAEELIEAVGDPKKYKEIVFCGYGEPFLRLDIIKKVAKWIKDKGGKVRINTNGHGNLIHERKILPELERTYRFHLSESQCP
ncbi:putative deoxyribonuclease YcfH [Thermodesulfovibrio sp. N1]|uniref:TatD family hydrolase n=1 Tax=Thermodesulfovibrio sp. N1 TaxID=1871110 RepID=UPI00083AC260|nr:TatD family hydrolase [Thermodesulfovibrio sp. N1]ODA43306.1 putative deoxyribonuclease YcfH [Thermodesulfovibrio sp. N1]